MKLISLAELQRLTGLSDRAMMQILSNGQLQCECRDNEIFFDSSSIELHSLVRAIAQRKQEIIQRDQNYISERISSLIAQRLEALFERALSIASGRK